MLLPWELLILLSLKGCRAGEMPRQVAFHDTPDMHTPLTGRLSHASLGYGFYLKGHDHGLRGDHEFSSFCVWAKSMTSLKKKKKMCKAWPNL